MSEENQLFDAHIQLIKNPSIYANSFKESIKIIINLSLIHI